jgi:hypothetical protein
MRNFNERLTDLQPYVLSIRFTKGLSVVDTMFNDGWSVPDSKTVGHEVISDKPNYYMLYPLNESIGIDEMLDYVDNVITLNIEREKKFELLKVKIKELEGIFRTSSLVKCSSLKFYFDSSIDKPSEGITLNDIPLTMDEEAELEEVIIETTDKVNVIEEQYQPIIINEEKDGNPALAKFKNDTFELPPKKNGKIELENYDAPDIVCKCGPDDMCPVCMESKY